MIRDTPEFDQRVADWLEADPTAAPPDVLTTVVAALPSIPQGRRALDAPWRFTQMTNLMRAAAGLAIVAVVGVGVLAVNSRLPGPGGPGTPAPSVTQPPSAAPTAAVTARPTATTSLDTLDPSSWTPYTSTVYGFTMGYPADWHVEQRATRPWTPSDGLGWESPGVDTFAAPEGDLAVSVWGVAVDLNPDPAIEMSWEDFEAWIETFCTSTKNGPCTGIHDRVVPMCPDGDTECHTGAMIVPFENSVAGFKGGDRGGVTVVVDGVEVTYWIIVSVWQPDSYPGLAQYGGGTRLIQAYLESMGAQMPSRGPVDHSNHP